MCLDTRNDNLPRQKYLRYDEMMRFSRKSALFMFSTTSIDRG